MRRVLGSCVLLLLGLAGCTDINPAYCNPRVQICSTSEGLDAAHEEADFRAPDERDLRWELPPQDMRAGCREGSDCESRICQADRSCAPTSDVIYVDNRGGRCTGVHAGTLADPLCTTREGLEAAARTGKGKIYLFPSSAPYEAVVLESRTLSLYGPGGFAGQTARIEGSGGSAVSVRYAGRVVLDGLELSGGAASTLSCQAGMGSTPQVTVLRSRLRDSAQSGVYSQGCHVIVMRSALYGHRSRGVTSESGGDLLIENCFIIYNNQGGVRISSGTGRVRFSTLVYNGLPGGIGGVECGSSGGTKVIEGSILVNNGRPVGGSQVSSACRLVRSAIDEDAVPNGSENRLHANPDFVGFQDFRLRRGAGSNACCIDQLDGVPGVADVEVDIDGTPRPQGPRWDIGGHEVK
ncbi:MAG: right-handed parallel beta-helix repeat-containing protein [Myxococcota bacterium]|nr:right-handed parallel beta-helix repeat-containing protein [Myxococcota bacterium]